jgi:hypothetical protein
MIRCIKFRRFEKNTLRGYADLQLVRTGLVIKDCCLHEKNGKHWISFPARRYEGPNGKALWSPTVEFAEGATQAREQFQRQAVEAVLAVANKTHGEAA